MQLPALDVVGAGAGAGTSAPTGVQHVTGTLTIRTLPDVDIVSADYEIAKRTTLPLLQDHSHPVYHQLKASANEPVVPNTAVDNDDDSDDDGKFGHPAASALSSYFWKSLDQEQHDGAAAGTVTWDVEDVAVTATGSPIAPDANVKSIPPSFTLHMNRSGSEPVDKAVQRLALTLQKKVLPKPEGDSKQGKQKGKKGKQSKKVVSNPVEHLLLRCTSPAPRVRSDESVSSGSCAKHCEQARVPTDGHHHSGLWRQLCAEQQQSDWDLELSLTFIRPTPTSSFSLASEHAAPANSDADTTPSATARLQVVLNPPTLVSIRTFEAFSQRLFVGIPVVVRLESLFATSVCVDWYVEEVLGSPEGAACRTDADAFDGEQRDSESNRLRLVTSNSFSFTPTALDVGRKLIVLVRLTNGREGDEMSARTDPTTAVEVDAEADVVVAATVYGLSDAVDRNNGQNPASDTGTGVITKEAFMFRNVIEPCPPNALLSLRRDFLDVRQKAESRTRRHSRGASNASCNSDAQPALTGMTDLRVMTYNILAELNASSPMAQNWFYPYIEDKSVMQKERRFPMLLHEILQYGADVVCLQEVDNFVFHDLLEPALTLHNYEGYYSGKDGSREGLAMFWSLDTFEAARRHGIDQTDSSSSGDPSQPRPEQDLKTHLIRDIFTSNDTWQGDADWSTMEDVQAFLQEVPELRKVLVDKLSHVLQTAHLVLRGTDRRVLVGNTHLFYHPRADHIRLLQAFGCLHRMHRERQQNAAHDKRIDYSAKFIDMDSSSRSSSPPMIFCGDLNSSPDSGAARLIFSRSVQPIAEADEGSSANDEQATFRWKNLFTFSWDGNLSDDEDEDQDEETNNCNTAQNGGALANVGADAATTMGYDPLGSQPRKMRPVPPTIALPASFPILRSGYETLPQYTHYLQNFKSTLDYILVSAAESDEEGALVPHRVAEVPDEELLSKDVAMPSSVFPSDHVSLVCDLRWSSSSGGNKKTQPEDITAGGPSGSGPTMP